ECSRVRLIPPHAFYAWKTKTHSDNQLLLDLFGEDSQLNVYRGELEVRRPGAPTSAPVRDLVRPCEVRRAEARKRRARHPDNGAAHGRARGRLEEILRGRPDRAGCRLRA